MLKEVIYTEEQLNERLAYWQEKLRLQDWIIELRIARSRNMMQDASAAVDWTLSRKMASINILDHIDYPNDIVGVRDMENDLVHELLHLHFAPISDHYGNNNDIYSTFEEQAIESIAYGLIAAERK
ncbi:hypothetical protein [Sporosarcina jiandibaonis]|uniref:hypothetical protein n=1 Tax=Sporosarcina jiandibaonis TaxID=2715535 RepID=UPI001553FC1A|nr:hypothetical protein [Sporosarcina jiandibaonis]